MSILVPRQVRWSHTDVRFPDFSEVRTAATRDPHETSIEADRERRFFSYAIAASMHFFITIFILYNNISYIYSLILYINNYFFNSCRHSDDSCRQANCHQHCSILASSEGCSGSC